MNILGRRPPLRLQRMHAHTHGGKRKGREGNGSEKKREHTQAMLVHVYHIVVCLFNDHHAPATTQGHDVCSTCTTLLHDCSTRSASLV